LDNTEEDKRNPSKKIPRWYQNKLSGEMTKKKEYLK